jgi:hypothetical protein
VRHSLLFRSCVAVWVVYHTAIFFGLRRGPKILNGGVIAMLNNHYQNICHHLCSKIVLIRESLHTMLEKVEENMKKPQQGIYCLHIGAVGLHQSLNLLIKDIEKTIQEFEEECKAQLKPTE